MVSRRASSFSLAELVAHWNLGYEGYFIPVAITEAALAHHVRSNSIDLDSSIVIVERDQLVGFSFLGRRGTRGWIGGLGIAPAYRGQGRALGLTEAQLAIARETGLAHVSLEVLEQNWAQKVYARAGFATTRELVTLVVTLPAAAPPSPAASDATIDLLVAHHARLHASAPACWQREDVSLRAEPALDVLALGPPEAPAAMLAVLRSPGAMLRLRDAAALDPAAATELVAALASRHPGTQVALVNEPEGSPFHHALRALGATVKHVQHEMHGA